MSHFNYEGHNYFITDVSACYNAYPCLILMPDGLILDVWEWIESMPPTPREIRNYYGTSRDAIPVVLVPEIS